MRHLIPLVMLFLSCCASAQGPSQGGNGRPSGSPCTCDIFIKPASGEGLRWCDYEIGTLTAETSLLGSPTCTAQEPLVLFTVTDLQHASLTGEVEYSVSDNFAVIGPIAALPLFSIEARPGPNAGFTMQLLNEGIEMRSQQGRTSTLYGHVDTLPSQCTIGSIVTRLKPLTFPDTAEFCVCKRTDIWSCIDLP